MVANARHPQIILVDNDGNILGAGVMVENAKFPTFIPVDNDGNILAFGDPNAPTYFPANGTTPTGTSDGDRWVNDEVEYFWDSALGASGAWVEVQSCTVAPQTNFAGIANATNLWLSAPPSGLSNGFVLSGLRLSGQPTATNFDASNYWELFIRYTLSSSAANVDLDTYTANSIGWNTGAQWSGINSDRFLVQPGGEVATFTARIQIGTGTPGNVNAMASVRVHRAIVPA